MTVLTKEHASLFIGDFRNKLKKKMGVPFFIVEGKKKKTFQKVMLK